MSCGEVNHRGVEFCHVQFAKPENEARILRNQSKPEPGACDVGTNRELTLNSRIGVPNTTFG